MVRLFITLIFNGVFTAIYNSKNFYGNISKSEKKQKSEFPKFYLDLYQIAGSSEIILDCRTEVLIYTHILIYTHTFKNMYYYISFICSPLFAMTY